MLSTFQQMAMDARVFTRAQAVVAVLPRYTGGTVLALVLVAGIGRLVTGGTTPTVLAPTLEASQLVLTQTVDGARR